MTIRVREAQGGASIEVRVTPGAQSDRILGESDGVLRVSLNAPPERGKANRALVRFLAKTLDRRASTVRIAAGERDRRKVVVFEGLAAGVLEEILGRRIERPSDEKEPDR